MDVVLEMSGGRMFDSAMEALAPFGRIAAYGIAGREQNDLQTGRLMRKSRAVIGFWLMHCLGRRDMMDEPLADLFERAARGELVPQVGETYPMSEIRRAHEDLRRGAPAASCCWTQAPDGWMIDAFSTSTCFPASMASRAWSRCSEWGVAT